jgi:hypothetical protein
MICTFKIPTDDTNTTTNNSDSNEEFSTTTLYLASEAVQFVGSKHGTSIHPLAGHVLLASSVRQQVH